MEGVVLYFKQHEIIFIFILIFFNPNQMIVCNIYKRIIQDNEIIERNLVIHPKKCFSNQKCQNLQSQLFKSDVRI